MAAACHPETLLNKLTMPSSAWRFSPHVPQFLPGQASWGRHVRPPAITSLPLSERVLKLGPLALRHPLPQRIAPFPKHKRARTDPSSIGPEIGGQHHARAGIDDDLGPFFHNHGNPVIRRGFPRLRFELHRNRPDKDRGVFGTEHAQLPCPLPMDDPDGVTSRTI